MARDLWKLRRVTPKIDLIKKTLTIPAFSLACGPTRGYISSTGAWAIGINGGFIPQGTEPYINAFTIEAWIKIPFPSTGRHVITQVGGHGINDHQISLEHENGVLIGVVLKGAAQVEITGTLTIPNNTWAHAALVYDGTDIRLYLNGVLDPSIPVAVAAPLDNISTIQGAEYYFGRRRMQIITYDTFVGFIDEVRYWTAARTQEEILNKMFHKCNAVAADSVEDDLYAYWSFDNYSTSGGAHTSDECDPVNSYLSVGTVFDEIYLVFDENAAPLGFGASFIAGQFTTAIGHKVSLSNWPLTAPDNANHSLVVRWTDDAGVIQRRLLYGSGNLDMNPMPAAYAGEPLNDEFILEVWNDDGEETADLASDYVLYTSERTQPTSGTDRTSVNTALAVNSALAEPFPLTFPLTFSTQQTY